MYNMDATELIGLDEATAKLGVERGQNDIVNVWKVLGFLQGRKNIHGKVLEQSLRLYKILQKSDDDDDDLEYEGSSNPNTGSHDETSSYFSVLSEDVAQKCS
ncbi:hypothetical protein V6N13_001802 [Hibiscus sabdariffa]